MTNGQGSHPEYSSSPDTLFSILGWEHSSESLLARVSWTHLNIRQSVTNIRSNRLCVPCLSPALSPPPARGRVSAQDDHQQYTPYSLQHHPFPISRGGILGGYPDRSLKSFPPCYSQTPLLMNCTSLLPSSCTWDFYSFALWLLQQQMGGGGMSGLISTWINDE